MAKANLIHLGEIEAAKFRVKHFLKEFNSFYEDANCEHSIVSSYEAAAEDEEYGHTITAEDIQRARASFAAADKELKDFMCSRLATQFIEDVRGLTEMSWALLSKR